MSFVHEKLRTGRWVFPWLRLQNLARYQWASSFVEGKDVIEIGCGSGQGSNILSNAGACLVDGYDLAADAIKEAQKNYGNRKLRFAVADSSHLPVFDGSYDVAVSLEVIEHVIEPGALLSEVARVLRPPGIFLCSTPNRVVTNPGRGIGDAPSNPQHVREYTRKELSALLSCYFGHIEFLGQTPFRNSYSRALALLGRFAPQVAARTHQLRKLVGSPFEGYERHRPRAVEGHCDPDVLIAICQHPIRAVSV